MNSYIRQTCYQVAQWCNTGKRPIHTPNIGFKPDLIKAYFEMQGNPLQQAIVIEMRNQAKRNGDANFYDKLYTELAKR